MYSSYNTLIMYPNYTTRVMDLGITDLQFGIAWAWFVLGLCGIALGYAHKQDEILHSKPWLRLLTVWFGVEAAALVVYYWFISQFVYTFRPQVINMSRFHTLSLVLGSLTGLIAFYAWLRLKHERKFEYS